MTEDASLDDFLDAGSEATDADGSATDDGGTDEPVTGDDHGETGGGDPTEHEDDGLSTYDWSPEGAPCAACGGVVERRWRDDPGLVCEACKEW